MIIQIIFALLIAGMFLALIRLLRGPSLPDRVVALDLMAMLSIALIATYTVSTNQQIFIDSAVVLAVIAFLGTAAFAYFIEKGALPWRRT
jgi:multicomponent Na+:H+ antiporter subunit F